MHDDQKKQDEFDDFDFDTFDDIEDESINDDLIMDAESIDSDPVTGSLDTFDENSEWEDDDTPLNNTLPKPAKSGNKLMLPVAVLGLAAIGGAGYFFLAGNTATPTQDIALAEADIQSGTPFPADGQLDTVNNDIPMPAPIAMPEQADTPENVYAQDDTSQHPDENTVTNTQDGDVLTPMPNAAAAPEVIADSTDVLATGLDLEAPETPPTQEQSSPIEIVPTADPSNTAVEVQTAQSIEITEAPNSDPFAQQENNPLGIHASNESASSAQEPQPTANQIPTQSVTPAISEQELAALETKLSGLESAVSEKDQTIQSLNQRISDLQKSLEDSEKRASELSTRQPAATPATEAPVTQKPKELIAPAKKVASPTEQAQPSKSRPTVPKAVKPTTEAIPKWELRSAQPGKAYIGIAGSNDVLVVEVGHTIQGIGRITSIAKNGSQWVVSGTKGEIVR